MTFKEYSLNITKFFTAPALAMGIFTSGYYDESKNKIKVIKVGPGGVRLPHCPMPEAG